MKNKSIRTAILTPSIAILVIGIIAMVSVVGVLSSNTTGDLTDRLIESRVNEYTNEFRVINRDVYSSLTATSAIVANYADPEFAADVSDPRGEIITVLGDVLLSNDRISGIWSCWEPNALDGQDAEYANTSFYDDTGRFIPSVYKDGSSYGVEALVGYDDPVDGEFYLGAKDSGKPYVTDPYYYNVDGMETYLYSVAIPIIRDGKVLGVVGADIDLNEASEIMNSASILDDGYIYTISPGGLVATHRNSDILMTRYDTTWMANYASQVEDVIKNGGSFTINAYSDVTDSNMMFLGTGVMVGDTGRYWIVCGVVPEQTVNKSSTSLLLIIIVIGAALIAVVGLTIFNIVRKSLQELPALTATANAIALGDSDTSKLNMGTGETKNEITLLERAFAKMAEGIRQQADVLGHLAKGDYSTDIQVRSDKDTMNQAIVEMLESTNNTLAQINTASGQVATGAAQIADGAQAMAQGATGQSASIQELSSSVSEIAGQTKENAELAAKAAELSGNIQQNAQKGTQQMDNMVEAVRGINEASQNIGRIIKVIDDIAFQTNILALNAAVEAARAGAAGQGFAVVADEVRNLASKSADAAKETGAMIENSINKAELGVKIAEETAVSLQEIVAGVMENVDIVNKIADSSEQQSAAISQVNTGIDQVTHVIQQNTATAEQSAAASQEMSGQAEVLSGLVAQFKLRDEHKDD